MTELHAAGVGVALLYAALVRAGSSPVTWWLFRRRLGRLLTTALALLLIGIAVARLVYGNQLG